MSEATIKSWSSFTVIEEDELLEQVFPISETSDEKLEVKNYCVALAGDTIDTSGFIEFISEKFPYFVFPEDKVEELGHIAYRDAQARAGYQGDFIRDGKYGELILFVLVEGLLEMPMISHKIAGKQNPSDEVKGSDGVFFGEYDGEESLGIGEAKFFSDKKGGIRDSLESTARFHGMEGDRKRKDELEVAARNLSPNIEGRVEELAERLVSPSRDYQILHPIFVGYESEELHQAQAASINERELEERILETVESDDDLLPYISERIGEEHPELEKHRIVFILLPVEDADRFRKRVKDAIYPNYPE